MKSDLIYLIKVVAAGAAFYGAVLLIFLVLGGIIA